MLGNIRIFTSVTISFILQTGMLLSMKADALIITTCGMRPPGGPASWCSHPPVADGAAWEQHCAQGGARLPRPGLTGHGRASVLSLGSLVPFPGRRVARATWEEPRPPAVSRCQLAHPPGLWEAEMVPLPGCHPGPPPQERHSPSTPQPEPPSSAAPELLTHRSWVKYFEFIVV